MDRAFSSSEVASSSSLRRTSRLADQGRAWVLGINAWAVASFLPALLGGLSSPLAVPFLLIPLIPLGIGVLLVGPARTGARFLLLGAFPATLAGLVAGLPALARQPPSSAAGTALGVLSLLAYGAAAAHAVGKPAGSRPAQLRPLGSVAPVEEHTGRKRLRQVVLAIAASGGALLVVVAPTLGGPGAYQAGWGDAAREASALTAVVGAVLATVVLTLFVGPTLRAARGDAPTWRRVRGRVMALVLTFVVGLAVYVLYALA